MGKLEKVQISIAGLNRVRGITVYLPDHYEQSSESYPVFYMHDGQNLFVDGQAFGGSSWGVSRHWNGPGQPQMIVVAIDNGGEYRFSEYSPYRGDGRAEQIYFRNVRRYGLEPIVPVHFGGEGKAYLQWIVHELKPYVDAHYRTKPQQDHTAIIGSSMGGLISLYAGMYYPDIFGKLGVLSPAFWFGCEQVMEELEKTPLQQDQMVFMSVGTEEYGIADREDYLADAEKVSAQLGEMNCQMQFVVIDGGIHNEKAWEPLLLPLTNYFLG